MAWTFQYSVECPVNGKFAWQFWSNVENWFFDVSLESVSLDGPFAKGTTGTTKPRGGDPLNWQLVEVEQGHHAVIELGLPGAVVRFDWQFDVLSDNSTRITQQVTLEGKREADYMAGVTELEQGIPIGMQKLSEEIGRAARTAAPEGGATAE